MCATQRLARRHDPVRAAAAGCCLVLSLALAPLAACDATPAESEDLVWLDAHPPAPGIGERSSGRRPHTDDPSGEAPAPGLEPAAAPDASASPQGSRAQEEELGPDALEGGILDALEASPDALEGGPGEPEPGADALEPGADAPEPGPDTVEPDLDIEGPDADIEGPDADIEGPDADTEGPDADTEGPDEDVAVPPDGGEPVGPWPGSCSASTVAEDCAPTEHCWQGSCLPVLGQTFRVTILEGGVGPGDPDGTHWDQLSGAPDLVVVFAAAGQPWSFTFTAWDSYSATWNQYVDATFAAGGGFYVELLDDDVLPEAKSAGAWAWLGDEGLVTLARTSGELLTVEHPEDPAIWTQLLVEPLDGL